MDAPAAHYLDSTSDVRNTFPALSPSQTTLPAPPPGSRQRNNLRLRPSELFDQQQPPQHVAVPPPSRLKESETRPELRPAPSSNNMSLFNLFSKPKIEKLRGYAEPGLDAPPSPPRNFSDATATTSPMDLLRPVQQSDPDTGRTRPSSSKSSASRSMRHRSRDPMPPLPKATRVPPFDPPPLFQVWPQATKHAVLEVSTISPELHKPYAARGRIPAAFFSNADMPSLNATKAESRATNMPGRGLATYGSLVHQTIPKKIIVLVTSGFLLQYAETGPNDRMPERCLRLEKDSAAFASDLIPGRHHVLQIAQTVNQHNTMSTSHHSLFSRLSLRKSAAKGTTSDFLLVMPDAQEMSDWMTAIRKEIEVQGGKMFAPDAGASLPADVTSVDIATVDLKKTPSQSHRYKVKRDPTRPSAIPRSPARDAFPSIPVFEMENVHTMNAVPNIANSGGPETLASAYEPGSNSAEPRAASPAASVSSSNDVSVEHQALDHLRASVRQSNTSTAATSVTAASRTSSITSTPPPESAKDGLEGVHEMPAKSPVRTLNSYSLGKRRSAVRLSLKDSPLLEDATVNGIVCPRKSVFMPGAMHSPVVGQRSSQAEHDSELRRRSATNERPSSSAAEMPSYAIRPVDFPSSQSPAGAPEPTLVNKTAVRALQSADSPAQAAYSLQSRPLRSGSNSFSLPLRVNPVATVPSQTIIPQETPEDRLISPIPAVHCLTAKVSFPTLPQVDRRPLDQYVPAPESVKYEDVGEPLVARTCSARLSLFPATSSVPPARRTNASVLRQTPSEPSLAGLAQTQANAAKLPRPNSVQIKAAHTPFLSSLRSARAASGRGRHVLTAPIRNLRPSRSLANMQTKSSACDSTTRNLSEEESDKATPLPMPVEGTLTSASGLSSRTRKVPRTRASLPELDFGLPLAGLGPPAPPPQTPLPEIPAGNRPPSRQRNNRLSMRPRTPIGLALGDDRAERMISSTRPAVIGLGIKAGGAD